MDYPNRDLLVFDRRTLGETELDSKQMRLNIMVRECRGNPISYGEGVNAKDGDDRVRFVQEALNMTYGALLEVDGKFGPETRKAVENFQREHGLKADGTVGPKTMQSIANEVNARNRASLAISDTQAVAVVHMGDGNLGVIDWSSPAVGLANQPPSPSAAPAVPKGKSASPKR